MATVRYLVQDVDAAIQFYGKLGFALEEQYGPAMAIVAKADLTLWLAGPAASAARAVGEEQPRPGGWSRFVLEVASVEQLRAELEAQGVKFRGGITRGPGGAQTLAEDPSGNLVELFGPR